MKYLLLILACATIKPVYCQQVPLLNLRFNEEYSVWKKDTSKKWYKAIKYIPLKKSTSSYVSVGGEYRYQLQYLKNEDWGDAANKEYTAIYNRLLLHSDFHMGKRFRFFGQLVSTTVAGKEPPFRSIDENRLDIQQIFADFSLLKNSESKLILRAGRQELLYGSQRLIAVREGPNNRLSFDAVKAFYEKEHLQLDLFYSRPVRNRTGVFDDPINRNEKLWSVYVVVNKLPIFHNGDFYYIGYQNKINSFYNISATENRHSIGARLWKSENSFQYDVEALYQFGKIGGRIIDAYTASANITYHFNQRKYTPSIGLKTEVISGDKSATDKKVNTFNPLFPRGDYFGLAALIGPVNLIDFHPSVEIKLHTKISFVADYDMFWRYSVADGIYGANVAMLYPAAFSKHIGNQLGISFEYTPIQYLVITPELTFFKAGSYLKEVSAGKEIVFAAITIQSKF
ncbi:alginate export family protein [Lacibacter sp. H407]|uniref:alginate export family protein n=1 Tax=Lacibacter sp. H407 TaxID=3133423 RepID=UPI0030BFC4B0